MKTAAKVFIWIGMIGGAWIIFPLIIGIFALQKIDNATCKDDLVGWGIATLICCSTLGGIFMLCIRDEELSKPIIYRAVKDENNEIEQEEEIIEKDYLVRLRELKELLDAEIITQEEFDEVKKEILFGKDFKN